MPATFSIITPSYNQLHYLKRCVASIRDQVAPGFEIRHLVIDGASTDGTPEWLRAEGIEHISEPDHGMYHALNKGLDMIQEDEQAPSGIWAWLNADEQYLEGAVSSIIDFFRFRPAVDMVSAGALIVDSSGSLLTHRKSLPLRLFYLRAGLYNFSCATFFRRRVLQRGVRFDDTLTAVADSVFIEQLLRLKCSAACLDRFVATYTFAAHNISNQRDAIREHHALTSGSRILLALAKVGRGLERVARKTRHVNFPIEYSIYLDPQQPRHILQSGYVSPRWPRLG